MKRGSLQPALLAVAVLLAARPAWAAVPLKELTQEKLRDWVSVAVKAGRADPARADFWKETDALIVVDPDRIVYHGEKGVPVSLTWECQPRRGLDGEERAKAKKDLQLVFDHAVRVSEGGLLSDDDAKLLAVVSSFAVGPNPAPPVVVANPDEGERLRRQLDEARAEVDRLRREAEPRRYIMVVQPSSMIYYDCASHCWLPGPASVVYYPAGSAAEAPRRELPRPPAFVAPTPTPAGGLPPPEAPRPPLEKPLPPLEKPSPEKKGDRSEEAVRVFWVGYRNYWQGDYDRALASFDSAVRLDDEDARFWYYKALAERGLGDAEKAEASAKRGRELHAALKPKADLIGAALERVQGQERRFLHAPEVVVSEER